MADQFAVALTGQDLTGPAWQALIANARAAQQAINGAREPMDRLASIAQQARAAFIALGGALAIRELVDFHKSVQQTVGALADQADAVGLSTDTLQAFQAAARSAGGSTETAQAMLARFNVTVGQAAQGNKDAAEAFIALGVRIFDQNGKVRDNAQLLSEASAALSRMDDTTAKAVLSTAIFSRAGAQASPVLREWAQGADSLTTAMKSMGQVADREAIETFNRLSRESEQSRVRIQNLYAQIAAPIQAAGMSWVARQFQELANSIALIGAHQGALGQLREILNIMTGGLAGSIAGADAYSRALQSVTDASARVIEAQYRLNQAEGGQKRDKLGRTIDVDGLRRELQSAQADLARTQAAVEKFETSRAAVARTRTAGPSIDDEIAQWAGMGGSFALPKTTGGEKRDRIGEELRQLQGNTDAARDAYDRLRAAAATAVSTEDLQRQVELQKRIADELARIGKYERDDPRVPKIKALVEEHERYETALKQLEGALKAADAAEKSFGDGTAEFARRQKELNEALGTGRLSQDAYTAANRAAAQAQQEQVLKAQQYRDGIEGLAAGMQYAMLQQERQNSSFNRGIQLYQDARSAFSGFFTEMNQGLRQGADVWTTFANAGLNALNRIGDKLMQMAAENLFDAAFGGKAAGGGIFGWLGGLFGGGGGGGGASFAGVPDFIAAGGFAFADGGRPPPGVPSIVGEEGPEWFVPDQPGTIYPNGTAPSGMGGGGANIVINQTVMVGSIVSQAQHERDLVRVREEAKAGAIAGLIEDKRSGGATRRALR